MVEEEDNIGAARDCHQLECKANVRRGSAREEEAVECAQQVGASCRSNEGSPGVRVFERSPARVADAGEVWP